MISTAAQTCTHAATSFKKCLKSLDVILKYLKLFVHWMFISPDCTNAMLTYRGWLDPILERGTLQSLFPVTLSKDPAMKGSDNSQVHIYRTRRQSKRVAS